MTIAPTEQIQLPQTTATATAKRAIDNVKYEYDCWLSETPRQNKQKNYMQRRQTDKDKQQIALNAKYKHILQQAEEYQIKTSADGETNAFAIMKWKIELLDISRIDMLLNISSILCCFYVQCFSVDVFYY